MNATESKKSIVVMWQVLSITSMVVKRELRPLNLYRAEYPLLLRKARSMMKGLLSNWQNFYMIMGTAAATLTGLMFVATTLPAGLDTHESIANAGIATFNTPTVVQFCTVLLLAGMLSAPWQTFSGVSILLGLFG